jgi:hypothetical protein
MMSREPYCRVLQILSRPSVLLNQATVRFNVRGLLIVLLIMDLGPWRTIWTRAKYRNVEYIAQHDSDHFRDFSIAFSFSRIDSFSSVFLNFC